jgi:hypothetical protein
MQNFSFYSYFLPLTSPEHPVLNILTLYADQVSHPYKTRNKLYSYILIFISWIGDKILVWRVADFYYI